MKKNLSHLWTLLCVLMLTLTTASCFNDPEGGDDPEFPTTPLHGCIIVNQGNYYDNISGSLGLFFNDKMTPKVILGNNDPLGDTPQNAVQLGAQLYVPCNQSSDLAVINMEDGSIRGRIKLHNPQFACTDGTYIYVTESDSSLARINPANTKEVHHIKLPGYPYACVYSNDRIYINLGTPYGAIEQSRTVAVVDTKSGRVTAEIKVGENPYDQMLVDEGGNIFTVCFGDYSAPEVWKISPDGSAEKFAMGSIISAYRGTLFVINSVSDYSNYPEVVTTNDYAAYNISDGAKLKTNLGQGEQPMPASPICMKHNSNGNIYITADGAEGYSSYGRLYIYSPEGLYLADFGTGVHPYSLTFTY